MKYASKAAAPREIETMRLYHAAWILWIAGTVVIVASWNHIVTPAVGWYGFYVALAGTVLSFFGRRAPQPGPAAGVNVEAELEKLANLRAKGLITEEEQAARRKQLLGL
jgi:hypothetical protein